MKGSKQKSDTKSKSDSVISDVLGVEQKREFKELFEIFAEFDTDGSGSISVQQWRQAMKRFGHEASEQQVQEMLRENSIKYGQDLTLFEFIGLINKKKNEMRGQEHTELVRAFRLFDKDLDGVLSASELKAGLERSGESMRLEDLELLVSMADKDRDNSINFQEFCRIMTLK